MGVERRSEEIVEPLQLACTLAVESCGECIEDKDASNDEEEPLLDAAGSRMVSEALRGPLGWSTSLHGDQDDGTDDASCRANGHAEAVREGVVDGVDVLAAGWVANRQYREPSIARAEDARESVLDSTEWRRIEEAHRSVQDAFNRGVMERFRDVVADKGCCNA